MSERIAELEQRARGADRRGAPPTPRSASCAAARGPYLGGRLGSRVGAGDLSSAVARDRAGPRRRRAPLGAPIGAGASPIERLLERPQRAAARGGRARLRGRCWCWPGAGSGKTRVLTHRDRLPRRRRAGEARARSSRSRSPTRPPTRCASGSRRWSAGSRADVGDDLPLRMRADPAREAERLGYKRTLHDLRRGRLAADGQAVHGRAERRPEALPAARDPGADLRREEPLHRRGELPRAAGRRSSRRRSPTSTGVREAHARGQRDGLRRPARPHGQPLRALRGRPRALPGSLPLGARRRVPGHQPRAVPAAAAAQPRSTATSAWSATISSRSTASATPTSATSSTSSATSPDTEVVKLEQNYRSTETILSTPRTR